MHIPHLSRLSHVLLRAGSPHQLFLMRTACPIWPDQKGTPQRLGFGLYQNLKGKVHTQVNISPWLNADSSPVGRKMICIASVSYIINASK